MPRQARHAGIAADRGCGTRPDDPGQRPGGARSAGQDVSFPLISPTGLAAFYGLLGPNPGVWSFQNRQLSLALRIGQSAPGAPAGATFAGPPPAIQIPAFNYPVSINPAGSLAFTSYLAGVPEANNFGAWTGPPDALQVKNPSTGATANALYSWTSSGGLTALVLPGQNAPGTSQKFAAGFPVSYSINSAQGQFAVFATLDSGTEGIWLSFGRLLATSLSENGILTCSLKFTDGTSGVFTTGLAP